MESVHCVAISGKGIAVGFNKYLLWAALVADVQWVLGLVSVSPGNVNLNLSLSTLGGIDSLHLLLPGSGWWLELWLLWSGAAGGRLAGGLSLLGGSWSANVGLASTLRSRLASLLAGRHNLLTASELAEILLDEFLSGSADVLMSVVQYLGSIDRLTQGSLLAPRCDRPPSRIPPT